MTNGSLDKRVIIPTYYLMNHSKIKTNYTPLRGSQSNTLSPFFFCCNPASIHEPFAKVSHCSATASWALTNIVDHTSMYTYICLCMYKCCRRFYLLTTLDCFEKKIKRLWQLQGFKNLGACLCLDLPRQNLYKGETCYNLLPRFLVLLSSFLSFCQGFFSIGATFLSKVLQQGSLFAFCQGLGGFCQAFWF